MEPATLRRCVIKLLWRPGCFRTAWCASLVASVLCSWSRADTAGPALSSEAAALLDLTSLKSPTGLFIVMGRDSRQDLLLMKWGESVAARLEEVMKIDLPRRGADLRIVVQAGETTGGRGVDITQDREDGRLVQRLVLAGYRELDLSGSRGLWYRLLPERVVELWCRLLLDRAVWELSGGRDSSRSAPAWLWQGAAQNVDVAFKARNSELVLEQWTSGRLLSPVYRLAHDADAEGDNGRDPALYRAVSGLWVQWLLSLPRPEQVSRGLLERLARGHRLSQAWLVSVLPDCDTVSAADELWDRWMLKQRRMVYQPGRCTPQVLNRFRAELLLYPGRFGIPLDVGGRGPIALRDLVGMRSASWMSAFARGRCAGLTVAALGRGDELGDVAAAYCRFFEALARRVRKERLLDLLRVAEQQLGELESRVRRNQGGALPASGAGAGP